jgi:hypothetical protein
MAKPAATALTKECGLLDQLPQVASTTARETLAHDMRAKGQFWPLIQLLQAHHCYNREKKAADRPGRSGHRTRGTTSKGGRRRCSAECVQVCVAADEGGKCTRDSEGTRVDSGSGRRRHESSCPTVGNREMGTGPMGTILTFAS